MRLVLGVRITGLVAGAAHHECGGSAVRFVAAAARRRLIPLRIADINETAGAMRTSRNTNERPAAARRRHRIRRFDDLERLMASPGDIASDSRMAQFALSLPVISHGSDCSTPG